MGRSYCSIYRWGCFAHVGLITHLYNKEPPILCDRVHNFLEGGDHVHLLQLASDRQTGTMFTEHLSSRCQAKRQGLHYVVSFNPDINSTKVFP